MITRGALHAAAAAHGIFVDPTLKGRGGAVLLASLGVDLGSESSREELLARIKIGELLTVACFEARGAIEPRLQASLVERGIPADHARRLVRRSWLDDASCVPRRAYYALLMQAQRASANALCDHAIRSMREWLGDREDAAAKHLRDACATTLGETATASEIQLQCAREICAQWWNRYAGVMR